MDDFYYEESNPKHVFIKCIVIIFVLGICFGGFLFYRNKNAFNLKRVEVELGSEISNDVNDYLVNEVKNSFDYKLYLSNVDSSKVGVYTYKVRHNKHVKEGKIVIKDTVKPEVIVDDVTVGVDEEINPIHLVTSCKDLSLPCSAVFEDENIRKKINTPGTYLAKIKVSDAVGNSVVVDVKIISKEDASFSSVITGDLDYYTNNLNDSNLDKIFFEKLDKAIDQDTMEYEKMIQEISSLDFEDYTSNEIKDIKLVTAYNKYMYVIGIQVLATYTDGTQELLENVIKEGN